MTLIQICSPIFTVISLAIRTCDFPKPGSGEDEELIGIGKLQIKMKYMVAANIFITVAIIICNFIFVLNSFKYSEYRSDWMMEFDKFYGGTTYTAEILYFHDGVMK